MADRKLLARRHSGRTDTTTTTVAVKRGGAEGAIDYGYKAVQHVEKTQPNVVVLGYWNTGERTPTGDPVYAVEFTQEESS